MILGVDTGKGTCGFAKLDEATCTIAELGVVIQPPHVDAAKNKTLEGEQRMSLQAEVIATHARGCDTVVVEQMSFPPGRFCPQCKRTGQHDAIVAIAQSFGVAIGIVAALEPRPRLVTIGPKAWQRVIVPGDGPIDYAELERVAMRHLLLRQPIAAKALERITKADRPHALDAAMMTIVAARRPWLLDAVEPRRVA